MSIIYSATQGNYDVSIDEIRGGSWVLVESVCTGGWWKEIRRQLCPVSRKEALRALAAVRTVATPTYEGLLERATRGYNKERQQ